MEAVRSVPHAYPRLERAHLVYSIHSTSVQSSNARYWKTQCNRGVLFEDDNCRYFYLLYLCLPVPLHSYPVNVLL